MNAEVNVMSVLIREFPDKKIFYDEYQVLKRDETICRELYNLAFHSGIDMSTEWTGRKAWLEMQGFVFPDMERDVFCEPYSITECQFATLDELIEFAITKWRS